MKKLFFYIGFLCKLMRINDMAKLFDSCKNYIYMGGIAGGFAHLGKGVMISRSSSFHDIDKISIGDLTTIGNNCVITAWKKRGSQVFTPSLNIGNQVTIGDGCHITCVNGISIGDGCQLGKLITITDNSHGKTEISELKTKVIERLIYSKGKVTIGNNVWIGDKATILPNVEIGDGCIVGANAVVAKSAPPYSVIVGNPAKVIKEIS